MASNNTPVSAQQPTMRTVLKMSEDEIKKQIRSTHNQTKQKLDFDPFYLFDVVKNILNPSIIVVDNIVQMACKGPGEEIAYETTVSILRNVLSSYPWHVKAVLTLASFALDYGEFSHLADQIDSSDQLTKSLGILKQVPIVLGRQGIEKYKNSFGKLDTLIKLTLDVVECVVELEKRIDGNNTKDVPELSLAIENMSIDVFWTIITIVDCMARICSLINDKDNTQELLPFTGKITSILKSLTDQIAVCDRQIVEIKAYLKFKRDLESLQGIVEFFKKLIFVEESHNLQQATISNNELVISRIEELKTKNVLLFFSDLDISEEDVSILKPIHKEITKIGKYKIVWIPIVEQWMQIKYEMLQSKYKMEWYIVPHFSSVSGIKYIKEEWKFKNKPIIVVLNEEGTIKHHDAFHMIKTWGIEALPFDYKREKELCKREDWFGWSMINFSLNISTWINEGKYIFFYGGEDEWIAQFHQARVKKDLVMGGGKIFIELFGVRNDGKGKDDLGIFWKNIENFYFSKSQKVTELETKTKEIQKLLSYKNDKGWVVLCKGARLVFSGYGTTVLTIFQKFDEWKPLIQQGSFIEECLLKQYNDKIKLPCLDFQVPTIAGYLTHSEKCGDCSEIMEMYIRFRCCCHKHHSTKAAH